MTGRQTTRKAEKASLAPALVLSLALAFLAGGCKDVPITVSLKVTHRVFPDFEEVHRVGLGERFEIGDEDYAAEAVEFIPDFVFDTETGEVSSRSKEPNNPGVRVLVFKGDEQIDEVWAFQGKGAPHFSKTSFLAFELLDFSGWEQRRNLEFEVLEQSSSDEE